MKKLLMTSTLLIVAATLAACSATPVRRSVKETWNDSLTASKIRYKMMRDSEVKKSRMHVQVFRGQVTLTGRAVSDTERARAEQLAKSVRRVTAVENYVHVVGGGVAPAATAAVAKTPKAGSPSAPTAGVATIEEKVIEEDFALAAPARVPTIRESTGSRAAKPAVASRKTAEPKADKLGTKMGTPLAKEAKLATVRQPTPTDQKLGSKLPSFIPRNQNKTGPRGAEFSRDKSLVEKAMATEAPAAKVVGQAKTGLPWDGEVYEDDASSIRTKSTAVTAKATTAVAAPKAPTAEGPSPQTSTPPPTDDLAREAAEELEKLRSKH